MKISLISDEVNGLLEIHFDNPELAQEALENFIQEGTELDIQNGKKPEQAQKDAREFFHLEEFDVLTLEEVQELSQDYSSNTYGLDILEEYKEKYLN